MDKTRDLNDAIAPFENKMGGVDLSRQEGRAPVNVSVNVSGGDFASDIEDEVIRIEASLHKFISPALVLLLALVLATVYMMRDMLLTSFHHAVAINSLSVIVITYGIYRIFSNNFWLYRTARFLKRIETIEANPSTSQVESKKLVDDLESQGGMLNTHNMQMGLVKMHTLGVFVITDNDARLIKSKLGSRVRHNTNQIPFFAGLLISFGLLGTFIGLIATVAAVAHQLEAVATSFGKPGGMDAMDMLEGLSKPLGGMGSAFGASLFGLGGSIILSGLNYFANHAQNTFIENASRWFDDHIPHIKPGLKRQIEQAKAELERVKREEKDGGPIGAVAQPAQIVRQTADAGIALPSAAKAILDMAPQQSKPSGGADSMEIAAFITLAEETHRQLRALGHGLNQGNQLHLDSLQKQVDFVSAAQKRQEEFFASQTLMFTKLQHEQNTFLGQTSAKQEQALELMTRNQMELMKLLQQQQAAYADIQSRLSVEADAKMKNVENGLKEVSGQALNLATILNGWQENMAKQAARQNELFAHIQQREGVLVETVNKLTSGQQLLQQAITALPFNEMKPMVKVLGALADKIHDLLERSAKIVRVAEQNDRQHKG